MSVPKSSRKLFSRFSRVLLFYLLSIIVFATVSGVTKNLFYANHISILLSALLTFFLVFVFAKWDKMTLSETGITLKKYSLPRFLSGFIIGFSMVVLQAVIVSNFANVKFSLSTNFSTLSIISSCVLYFLIACREEFVFRSYALRNLAIAMNPILALMIITIIFILEHIIAGVSLKMSILGSGFGGVLFGLAALKTKGLALPLGLHFAWNFTQWLLGFKDNTGVWSEIVEKGNAEYAENVALIGFIVVMSITICGILIYYKGEKIVNGNL